MDINTELLKMKQNFPYLDIKNRNGATDYIDFLTWDEVNYPIMQGIDIYNRHFIVIKFILSNGEKLMQTFFQRYTNGTFWHGCGHASPLLLSSVGGLKNEQFILLKKILNGENVKILEKHNPEHNYYLNKYVQLFDEKKHNASIIIQKNWRKCRYDPDYKMCKKVLINNIRELEAQYNFNIIN